MNEHFAAAVILHAKACSAGIVPQAERQTVKFSAARKNRSSVMNRL